MAKDKPKCQVCGREATELFENVSKRGSIWACVECSDIKSKNTGRGHEVYKKAAKR